MTTQRNGDGMRAASVLSLHGLPANNRSAHMHRRASDEQSARAVDAAEAKQVGSPPSGDELQEFLAAMAGVAPLVTAAAEPALPARAASEAQLARRHAAETDPRIDDPNYLHYRDLRPIAAEEVIEYFKEGVQHGVRKKLRRGDYLVQDVLDLHRKTVVEARHELFWFLQRSLGKELRLVLVSHGKGLHSDQPGRLKSHVAHWLRQIPEVVAYYSALRTGGGTGAVYVLLRKGENERIENRERHGHKGRLDHTR